LRRPRIEAANKTRECEWGGRMGSCSAPLVVAKRDVSLRSARPHAAEGEAPATTSGEERKGPDESLTYFEG
jgi:hypothetical protein